MLVLVLAGMGSGKTTLMTNYPELQELCKDDKTVTDDNGRDSSRGIIQQAIDARKNVNVYHVSCDDEDALERMIERNESNNISAKTFHQFSQNHVNHRKSFMHRYEEFKDDSLVKFILLTNPKSSEEREHSAFSTRNISRFEGEDAYAYVKARLKTTKEMEQDAAKALDDLYIRRHIKGQPIHPEVLAEIVKHDGYVIPNVGLGATATHLSDSNVPASGISATQEATMDPILSSALLPTSQQQGTVPPLQPLAPPPTAGATPSPKASRISRRLAGLKNAIKTPVTAFRNRRGGSARP